MSRAPKGPDLTRARGDDETQTLVLRDRQTRQVLDLSGYSFLLTVNTLEDPDTATSPGTVVLTMTGGGAADGSIVFTPTSDVDAMVPNVDEESYFYDIERTDMTSSRKKTILKGRYYIFQDITK